MRSTNGDLMNWVHIHLNRSSIYSRRSSSQGIYTCGCSAPFVSSFTELMKRPKADGCAMETQRGAGEK
jgi:hypothetical protein